MTAPVLLFAFNRPSHLRATLDALAQNHLANDTDLIIKCDGPRSRADERDCAAVAEVAHAENRFRSVRVDVSDANRGLARSIIEGVGEAMLTRGTAIVLEDDILTSQGFLTFMNAALNHYRDTREVWHISGWGYPTPIAHRSETATLWRTMNCWGWATWADRWQHFSKDPESLAARFTPTQKSTFNLDGAYDFWRQVELNRSGRINTWAVFWYATIFEHGGLCLNPWRSFTRNIGLDGSGENCSDFDMFGTEQLNQETTYNFPAAATEDSLYRAVAMNFYRTSYPNLLERALRRVRVAVRKGLRQFG